MSGSAKKKLIQKKLPFAFVVSDKAKTSSPQFPENLSPNVLPVSRKRKPSGDAEGTKSKKRVTVDPKDVVEIKDSDDETPDEDPGEQSSATLAKGSEVTPTTAASVSVLHIKLPSCSKRKVNTDVKPLQKSLIEEDKDDSVVYLDEEEVRESVKKSKSAKKSEKKKKKKVSLTGGLDCVRKTLNMNEDTEEQTSDKGSPETADSNKNSVEDSMEVDDDLVEMPSEVIEPAIPKVADKPDEQKIETIPSEASSREAEDPDAIHDEIIEMLSDNSESSPQNNTSLNIDSVGKTPTNKMDLKNMTPKQLARRQEQETRRLEKESQRQKERELKEQQRLKEKEMREEAKRKEKEDKEEVRQKEKDGRDKKRQEEQDKKDEEKRIKEEERKRVAEQREEEKRQKEEEKKRQAEQREEEKRQKEEEKKRQAEQREEEKRKLEEAKKKKEQEEEIRKKKAAEAFSKFFVTKKKTEATTADDDTSKDSAESAESIAKAGFMPFQVRQTTKVAPLVRLQIGIERQMKLDEGLKTEMPRDGLYLNVLKSALYKPGKSEKTWPTDDKDSDVVLIDELEGIGEDIQMDESKTKMKHRAKFLKFKENRRPAFHGTWRKKSMQITARRPFAQDQIFDYEVESDDEWEEEEPGESLHGTDSEKEKDFGEESDYDIDNDFMVPHGHLSDEEMQQNDDEEMRDNHPEAQKAKLKILQQEFAAEMKKKTEKIKPRLIGCIWMNGDEDENGCSVAEKKYHCSDIIWRILKAREMMTREDGVKLEENLEPEVLEVEEEPAAPAKIQVRQKFNDVSIKEFIRLLHGNTNNKRFLIKEFQAYRLKNYHKEPDFLEFFVKSVEEKMTEIVDYKTCAEEGPLFGKKCWLVKADVLSEHFPGDELKLPNEWTYILEKEVKEKKPKQPQQPAEEAPEPISTATTSKIKVDEKPEEAQNPTTASASPAIVKKPASPAIVKKSASPLPSIFKKSALPSPVITKKRVQLLVSGPRGQEIPQAKKNNSISQYLKGIPKENTTTSKASDVVPQEAASSKPTVGDDEVVVID